jgi:hypothetical protein
LSIPPFVELGAAANPVAATPGVLLNSTAFIVLYRQISEMNQSG